MSGFGFDTLGLLVVVGLAGPLLASVPICGCPSSSANCLSESFWAERDSALSTTRIPRLTLLANVGFALVMFVVGTHVPVHDSTLRSAIPWALARAVLVGAVAAGLGVGIAAIFGTGHAALYAVLMASSSAALALPVIDGLGLRRARRCCR